MRLLIPLFIGVAFGGILQAVGASRYDRIHGTLRLRDLTILKFMILTIGVAAIGIGILASQGLAHLSVKPLNLVAVLGGGLVFGAGFALAGYCPGTCVVGAAEGRRDALATLAGGLAGALAFTAVYRWIEPVLSIGSFGKVSLAGTNPLVHGVLFGAGMIMLSFVLPAAREERQT